jgi:2-polyprenyl-3-methyl-5-hydroxy-6-metoxy-1,4-benzoquinol methylase
MSLRERLISPAYRAEQAILHADPRGYGGKGKKWADVVEAVARERACSSILDYGCGQGSLGLALRLRGWEVREYDPAIAGKDGRPSFADLVVCTDVLEHVEPELLDNVLAHLRGLARKAVWCVVSTCETAKTLSDGRNAHLTIEPAEWWVARLTAAGLTICPPPSIARDRSDKEWIAVLLP